MEVKILNLEQIRFVYQNFLMQDFVDDERRSLGKLERLLSEGSYICYGAMMQGAIIGYAFFYRRAVEGGRADYLFDYLGIRKDLRGRGYGSLFLSLMMAQFSDVRIVVVEVENPDYADNPLDKELQVRRLQFYERNGAKDLGLTVHLCNVEYRILVFGTNADVWVRYVRRAYSELCRGILSKECYENRLWFH